MSVGPWPSRAACERRLRDREDGEHVVAVDAQAREAEAVGALVERDAGLALERLADRPLVVLAEEHDRRVVDRGEDERLVDVALARRAVAEVGDDRRVGAVALDAHRVADGVQALVADDDRVEREVVLVRVPAAVADAAEEPEQLQRLDAARPRDAVLAVGREGEVVGAQRASGSDLRRLLAEQLGPQAELALALERGGLGVDPAHQHEVAVERAQLVGRQVDVVLGMVDPLALRGEELDELGASVCGHGWTSWRLPSCGVRRRASGSPLHRPRHAARSPHLGTSGAGARYRTPVSSPVRCRTAPPEAPT